MAKAVDLTGQRFGSWMVVRRVENSRFCVARFLCTCSCGSGRERIMEANKIRRLQSLGLSGMSLPCQCKMTASGKGRHTLLRITGDELRALYEGEGMSTTVIGERLGVSASVVLIWLRNFGIPVRTTSASRKLWGSRRVQYQCQRCGKTCETFVSQPRKTCGRGCPGRLHDASARQKLEDR